jgi:hypothetical protein
VASLAFHNRAHVTAARASGTRAHPARTWCVRAHSSHIQSGRAAVIMRASGEALCAASPADRHVKYSLYALLLPSRNLRCGRAPHMHAAVRLNAGCPHAALT